MKFLNPLKIALAAAMLFSTVIHAGVLATFDNLPMPPALDSASGLHYTNAFNSQDYQGITWDSHFRVFGALSGVTGYLIDRRMPGASVGHWVADDFQFSNVSDLPEPGMLIMLGTCLAYLLAWSRRQAIKSQRPARLWLP